MNTQQLRPVPKSIAAGLCLAMLGVLFGFGLGGLFGMAEDSIKQRLEDSGTAVLATVYEGDVAKKDAVVSKSWTYLKRAHLHGGAIGAVAIGSILALLLLGRVGLLAKFSALALGAGTFIYAWYWLLAGFTAPGLGSTGAAKESLTFVGIPGAGLCILGLVGAIVCVMMGCCCRPRDA